ncbi:hypothetical protein KKA03_01045 [archaeon]|nr:hypothetical protein [archaeon]
MEDITSFAFAGLFSMFILSLNFSFLLHIKLKNMSNKFEEMENQMGKSKESDKLIIEELDDIVRLMEKLEPALDKVISK